MSLRIKISGITNYEDAAYAVYLGVDVLGFNFNSKDRRFIAPVDVMNIIRKLPPFTPTVGVFVNEKREQIEEIVNTSGVDVIHFHGDERPTDCNGYSLKVIKTMRVDDKFEIDQMKPYQVSAFFLDSVDVSSTGSGYPFDWTIAEKAKENGDIVLSGGLNPENARKAIIEARPYCVSVNSGVESSVGKKDRVKMRDFVRIVRSTNPYY